MVSNMELRQALENAVAVPPVKPLVRKPRKSVSRSVDQPSSGLEWLAQLSVELAKRLAGLTKSQPSSIQLSFMSRMMAVIERGVSIAELKVWLEFAAKLSGQLISSATKIACSAICVFGLAACLARLTQPRVTSDAKFEVGRIPNPVPHSPPKPIQQVTSKPVRYLRKKPVVHRATFDYGVKEEAKLVPSEIGPRMPQPLNSSDSVQNAPGISDSDVEQVCYAPQAAHSGLHANATTATDPIQFDGPPDG